MAIEAIDAQGVLAQMRALAAQARGEEVSTRANAATDFGAVMREALDYVNANQQRANALADRFERGEPGIDVADVMVALQKANISFQAATQVRNRLVSAYQDIMNMPL
jgi:flagellar hook-basal body complex protein FliE